MATIPPLSDPATPPQQVLDDTLTAAVNAATDSLGRRGYMKTELWAHLVAIILAVCIAKVGVSSNVAVQVSAELAPIVVSTVFNWLRVKEKVALTESLAWLHQHVSHLP